MRFLLLTTLMTGAAACAGQTATDGAETAASWEDGVEGDEALAALLAAEAPAPLVVDGGTPESLPVTVGLDDEAAQMAEEARTREELLALVERAGLEPWEHPELERALENPDGMPMADVLRRRIEILRAVPQRLPSDGWISSTFGKRKPPGSSVAQMHKGLDVAAVAGTPVYAPADGIVRFAGRYGGFGNFVAIVHGYGIVTKYAHNQDLHVKKGDRVKAGDLIATVGSSGRSRGVHLHYEVWVNDRAVDPLGFMPPQPGLSEDPGRLVAHTGEP